MKEKITLDFPPNNSYKIKIISVVALIISVLFFALNLQFRWSVINDKLIELIIATLLFIISFSKDKNENDKNLIIKYYAGKIAVTYIFSFIISLNIFEIIKSEIISISSITYVLIGLIFYQICLLYLKFITHNKEVEIKNTTIYETYNKYSKYYLIAFGISILTLLAIIILK